jgi:predicted chitinase
MLFVPCLLEPYVCRHSLEASRYLQLLITCYDFVMHVHIARPMRTKEAQRQVGYYLSPQLQLAAFLLQPDHTSRSKMRLSNWLQPSASALLTWTKTTIIHIQPPYHKYAIKTPDTVIAFISSTIDESRHLTSILYLSP